MPPAAGKSARRGDDVLQRDGAGIVAADDHGVAGNGGWR